MEGHFLLTSGLHSPQYWEKMRLLQDPRLTRRLCRSIARHFQGYRVRAVAGPSLGGVVLAYEVARQLGVRAVYAEREGEARVFRQGQLLLPGERVLIVDDVLTTGGSLRQMGMAVQGAGAEPVGIGVLVDRRPPGAEIDLGVELFSCHRASPPVYSPEDCPLCRQGLPLTRPGGKR